MTKQTERRALRSACSAVSTSYSLSALSTIPRSIVGWRYQHSVSGRRRVITRLLLDLVSLAIPAEEVLECTSVHQEPEPGIDEWYQYHRRSEFDNVPGLVISTRLRGTIVADRIVSFTRTIYVSRLATGKSMTFYDTPYEYRRTPEGSR